MRILYVQHTSVLGGSSKSLLELISNLPKEVEAYVLCPNGKFSDLLKRKGIKVYNIFGIPQFDNTRYGYYRGVRWLILLREFCYLPFLFLKIFQLRKENFDLVHINDLTQIYSVILAKIFIAPTVVHCRSMQSTKRNIRYKIINFILKYFTTYIISIDKTVASTLDLSLNIKVIHNGLTIKNINSLEKKKSQFTVGIVSNFQRYKGIVEYLEAASICINEKELNIKFLIFGTPYQNASSFQEKVLQMFGFREDLKSIIQDKIKIYNLQNIVELKGFVSDTNEIYNNIDLLTFPSHLNAVGRPVFEAAFYKIPSIVAINNKFEDSIIDNVTGICIEEKDSRQLADAIALFYQNNKLLVNMGQESYNLAIKYYDSEKNAMKVYNLYEELMLRNK